MPGLFFPKFRGHPAISNGRRGPGQSAKVAPFQNAADTEPARAPPGAVTAPRSAATAPGADSAPAPAPAPIPPPSPCGSCTCRRHRAWRRPRARAAWAAAVPAPGPAPIPAPPRPGADADTAPGAAAAPGADSQPALGYRRSFYRSFCHPQNPFHLHLVKPVRKGLGLPKAVTVR
jgi:hypothetical protein